MQQIFSDFEFRELFDQDFWRRYEVEVRDLFRKCWTAIAQAIVAEAQPRQDGLGRWEGGELHASEEEMGGALSVYNQSWKSNWPLKG